LIFSLLDQRNNLNEEVIDLLDDFSNVFYVSSLVVREAVLLLKEKKIKHPEFKFMDDLFIAINIANYEIKPFTKHHVLLYAKLETPDDHKDPTDHMIISQSISDKIPIISSDRKFKLYENQGLQLVFNKR